MTTTTDVYTGLKTALENGISDLRIYPRQPDVINELPGGMLVPATANPNITFGGTTTVYTVDLIIYVASADTEEAWEKAQNYFDNSGGNSVDAAIAADSTLGGAVQGAFVRQGQTATRGVVGAGDFAVAEFTIEYVR